MIGHDHKSGMFGLNFQTTTALVWVFLSGCVLLIAALLFAVNIDADGVSLIDSTLLTSIILGLVCLGVIMILIGLIESLMLIGRNTKLIEKLVEKRLSESPVLELPQIQSPVVSPPGGKLQVIRPESSRFEAKEASIGSKPAPVSAVPSPTPVKASVSPTPSTPQPSPVSSPAAPTSAMTFADALQSIVTRYNTEKVKKSFQGWVNTLMMTFPDVGKSYVYKIDGDQGIVMTEGVDENAAVQVKLDSTIFIKMLSKQINPIKAYSSGSLEVKGEMKNMLKLRGLMF